MSRIIWQIRYAWLALTSPYQISPWSAWWEAVGSWNMNQSERGPDPMPTPADALYEDQYEWGAEH